MEHYHGEIRVEAPVEHVWGFLCDTSRWSDWSPRSEYTNWSGPVDEVGTTFVETIRLMGFEMQTTNTIVEVEPKRLIHMRSEFSGSPLDTFFRLAPEGDATLVTAEVDYEVPGHLPGFVKNLMTKNWLERQGRQQLEDFKALAEAEVAVHA